MAMRLSTSGHGRAPTPTTSSPTQISSTGRCSPSTQPGPPSCDALTTSSSTNAITTVAFSAPMWLRSSDDSVEPASATAHPQSSSPLQQQSQTQTSPSPAWSEAPSRPSPTTPRRAPARSSDCGSPPSSSEESGAPRAVPSQTKRRPAARQPPRQPIFLPTSWSRVCRASHSSEAAEVLKPSR